MHVSVWWNITDDIEIIFSWGNWEAKAEFAQTDVHRQIAIVFKSPPYQEQDIAEEVEVNVSLRRISDRMYSEPVKFTYLPHNPGQHMTHCSCNMSHCGDFYFKIVVVISTKCWF